MQDARHDEEGHVKNYTGPEAIQKLKDLAEDARICMFTTFSAPPQPLNSRPMALQKVEADGKMYFFSAASSNKNQEITIEPHAQLFFANNSNSEYLSIYGKSTISQDRQKIKELWTPWAKAWFQEGPEDPDLTLVTVTPITCEYWDTKHNKMVSLLKVATSIVTGKVMDDGVEGTLTI